MPKPRSPAKPPTDRPYRFVYDQEENAAVLMRVATVRTLEARGDLFLWAFLHAEAAATFAQVRDVIGRHVGQVLENEETYYPEGSGLYYGLAAAYYHAPVPEVAIDMMTISVCVTRGQWPKQSVVEVAFGLDDTSGVKIRCTGFPERSKLLPPVPRCPKTIDDARAVAVELVNAAVMLLLPFLDPFPETQHAGEVSAKVREMLPPQRPR